MAAKEHTKKMMKARSSQQDLSSKSEESRSIQTDKNSKEDDQQPEKGAYSSLANSGKTKAAEVEVHVETMQTSMRGMQFDEAQKCDTNVSLLSFGVQNRFTLGEDHPSRQEMANQHQKFSNDVE